MSGTRRSGVQVNIRLTQEEAERIRLAAERDRKTVSGLIRSAALQLAAKATAAPAPGAPA